MIGDFELLGDIQELLAKNAIADRAPIDPGTGTAVGLDFCCDLCGEGLIVTESIHRCQMVGDTQWWVMHHDGSLYRPGGLSTQ